MQRVRSTRPVIASSLFDLNHHDCVDIQSIQEVSAEFCIKDSNIVYLVKVHPPDVFVPTLRRLSAVGVSTPTG